MSKPLNLEYLRKQAKTILKKCRDADPGVIERVRSRLPRLAGWTHAQVAERIQLADIHHMLAHEKGYSNWSELKRHDAPLDRFLAAVRGGALKAALAELRASPAIIEESIHAAAAIGNAEAVRHHLDAAPELLHGEVDRWEPLVYACASPIHRVSERHAAGIVECIELLLDRGADPDTSSAVRRALVAGNRSAGLVLCKRGANPASVGPSGETSFKQAFWGVPENPADLDKALAELFKDAEVVAEMNRRMKEAAARHLRFIPKGHAGELSPKDVYAPMYPSNQDYNIMIWELLIKRGVQPNWKDKTQDSPLHHLAMWNGDRATAEFFLANGADPNLRRADGKTPYFLAVRAGNKPVADVLLAYGAKPDSVGITDELVGACRRVDVRTASSIVRRHPDVSKQLDTVDIEAFVEAAGQNRLDIVKLMLETGFNPAAGGESGATALHAAAWHGHVEMVRLLLKFGAPTDVGDSLFGASPRQWGVHGSKHCRDAAQEYEEVLRMLGTTVV
jgi:ankyrin repeat protein